MLLSVAVAVSAYSLAPGPMDDEDAWSRAAASRGGYLQSSNHLRAGFPENPNNRPTESRLCHALLLMFGWGLISGVTASWLAREALADGLEHPRLQALAACGSYGHNQQNTRRDILNKFVRNMGMPRPLCLNIRMLDKAKALIMHHANICSPFALIHYIWTTYSDLFASIFGSNPENFWRQVPRDDPKWSCIPDDILADPAWMTNTYPLIIHGDGAPYNKKGAASIIGLQYKSLLVEGNEWVLPITNLCSQARANKNVAGDSLEDISTMIAHLFTSLKTGWSPRQDPWERDWPPGCIMLEYLNVQLCQGTCRFIVWLLGGDAQWFADYLRCPHYGSTEEPCHLCPANMHPASIYKVTDFQLDASFKDVLYGPDMEPMSDHPLVGGLGCTRQHNPHDWMHAGDLGVWQRVGGSILQDFVTSSAYEGRLEQRNESLWRDILFIYDQLGTKERLANLTLNMYYTNTPGHAPCMSCKAAEMSDLMFVLRAMCYAFRSRHNHDLDGEVRLRMIDCICNCITVVKKGSPFLTAQQSGDLLSNFEEFLMCNNHLMKSAFARGQLRYHVTIKHHSLWHCCYLARYINPRLAWGYPFEDWMGRLVLAAKCCTAGSPPALIGNKVTENAMLVIELNLRQRRGDLVGADEL